MAEHGRRRGKGGPRGGGPGAGGRPGAERKGRGGRRRGGPKGGGSTRYLVPGERAVRELLLARPKQVRALWFDLERDFPELEALAHEHGVKVERHDREQLEQAVGEGLARGVVADAEPPAMYALDQLLALEPPAGVRRQVLVALDGVVDPGNLGAILRSAEFFGVQGAFWAKDRSAPLSALAVRASVGATERVPMGQVTNLSRALREAKDAGWWVVGTLPEGAQPLRAAAAALPERLIVVMGSEARGLRRLTIEQCDYRVRIEQVGALASLNVSAAAAVVFAELAGAAEGPAEAPKADDGD